MTKSRPILLLASVAALTLALHQGAMAEAIKSDLAASGEATAQTAPPAQPVPATEAAAPAPAVETPASPGATPETAAPLPDIAAGRERMEERQAEIMAQRRQRYEELRARAAEVGLTLPETPPWEQSGPPPPEMPTPPPSQLMSEEERQAHWETMRNLTPEQHQAMRDAHWQQMQRRAQGQGIDVPELPPWKQAEQRREQIQARWEKYREIVDQLSQEQREAAEAIFGARAQRPQPTPPMNPQMPGMPMQAPYGGDYGMPQHPMMPGYGQGPAPSTYRGGPSGPWYGGEEGMRQGPPPPDAGYDRPW